MNKDIRVQSQVVHPTLSGKLTRKVKKLVWNIIFYVITKTRGQDEREKLAYYISSNRLAFSAKAVRPKAFRTNVSAPNKDRLVTGKKS